MNADRDAGASQQAVIAPVRHEVVVSAPIERAFRVLNAGPELADGVRDGWGTALRQFADAVRAQPAPEAQAAPAGAQAAPTARPPAKYVLSYTSVPDFRPLAQQHFPAHYARLMTFHERGDLLMIGVLLDPVNGDAMAVFASREAAEEFVAQDPFVLNKVVESWSIRPWQEILYRHGTDRG